MPNRLVHESICTSETIELLTPEEEVFFYRLLVRCDDYGRFDARLPVLLAHCFPLRLGRVKESHIRTWLGKLQSVGLLCIYVVDSRLFLQINKWDRYQQGRALKAKYPEPPKDESGHLISLDINGNQMNSSRAEEFSLSPTPPLYSKNIRRNRVTGRGVGEGEGEEQRGRLNSCDITPPPELAEFDAVLREWDTYNPSVKFYEQVAEQYGHLPLKLEAVKATEWLRGKRKRRCSTAFMLNWLGNAAERCSLRASPNNGRVVERIGPELRTVEEVLRHD